MFNLVVLTTPAAVEAGGVEPDSKRPPRSYVRLDTYNFSWLSERASSNCEDSPDVMRPWLSSATETHPETVVPAYPAGFDQQETSGDPACSDPTLT